MKDQLPCRKNSEIKVTLDENSLKPDEQKRWRHHLETETAPGEKREFIFGIVVEYPKEREDYRAVT